MLQLSAGYIVVAAVCVIIITSTAGQVLGRSVEISLDYGESSNCSDSTTGLTTNEISLQYLLVKEAHPDQLGWIDLAILPLSTLEPLVETLTLNDSVSGFQLRLLQLEHGGGTCNCWTINSLTVDGQDVLDSTREGACFTTSVEPGLSELCYLTASQARGVITGVYYFPGNNGSNCIGDTDVTLISSKGPSLPLQCHVTIPRIEVSFELDLQPTGGSCDGIQDLAEAIEFSMRTGDNSPWVPLQLNYFSSEGNATSTEVVRGYSVFAVGSTLTTPTTQLVFICGDMLLTGNVQFRWMGTAMPDNGETEEREDAWTLHNVVAYFVNEDNETVTLFEDTFENEVLNSSVWLATREATTDCASCSTSHCPALTFGASNNSYIFNQSLSRIAVTGEFAIGELLPETTQSLPITSQLLSETASESPTTPLSLPTTTHDDSLTTTYSLHASNETYAFIMTMILNDQQLINIANAPPFEAVVLLQELVHQSVGEPVMAAVVVYLLGDILDDVNVGELEDRGRFVETFLNVSNALTTRSDTNVDDIDPSIVGSSLLSVLDRLALLVFPEEDVAVVGNIIAQTRLVALAEEQISHVISSKAIVNDSFPLMWLKIPSELNDSVTDGEVRTVSFLFYNVESSLFSAKDNESVLASGIVSTALQCDNGRCPTDDLMLSSPVLVKIQHSEKIKMELTENSNLSVKCVFWEFLTEGILSTGQWSERGCDKNESLSSTSVTVCECNHLTHFAILLSAAPLNVTESVVLSLVTIGYVGVTVSLITMGITIAIFVMLRSLHNMRTFIHVNLCISLAIAQLIFVAGVNKSTNNPVPIHCQAIAVLLHYFFLVSFMWMLMEGVVLYVILVRVFVTNTRRYILAYTIASYGVPLLYMGLTIPLGFALPVNNYGYQAACFLNPETKFIWAFIAPVIVIILINIGFIIMAAVIIWKHNKKKSGTMDKRQVKRWLKVLASLVIVMGLTWISGVLIVAVEEMLPLAYIFTIMVAFQGVWIFFIFIVYPKDVRDACSQLWKTKDGTSGKKSSTAYSTEMKFRKTMNQKVLGKEEIESKNLSEGGSLGDVVVKNCAAY